MTVPLVKQAQKKISGYLSAGDNAIDATMGNGFDTLFLANCVGKDGQVYAFDLQKEAVAVTENLLTAEGVSDRVQLIEEDHARMALCIVPNTSKKISCVMFNLGYLPGSDKSIQTVSDSTILALDAAIELLARPGIISILAYTGHAGGREEAEAVKSWVKGLSKADYRVTIEIPKATKNSPPELILIEAVS